MNCVTEEFLDKYLMVLPACVHPDVCSVVDEANSSGMTP
jgi:hypothetical protein